MYHGKPFIFRPDFSLLFDLNLLIPQFCALRQTRTLLWFLFCVFIMSLLFHSSPGFHAPL